MRAVARRASRIHANANNAEQRRFASFQRREPRSWATEAMTTNQVNSVRTARQVRQSPDIHPRTPAFPLKTSIADIRPRFNPNLSLTLKR